MFAAHQGIIDSKKRCVDICSVNRKILIILASATHKVAWKCRLPFECRYVTVSVAWHLFNY